LADKIGTSVEAVLCTSPENIYFFTGFRTMLYTRFTATVIRMDRPEEPVLIAVSIDRRLIEDRIWSPPWVSRIAYHGTDARPDVFATPAQALAPHLTGVRRIGVDSIKLAELEEIRQAAPNAEIVRVIHQIDSLKAVKGEQEIGYLRQANRLAMQGMEKARAMLARGPVTELELAVQLEAEARLAGADGFGYPTLVSCGTKMGAPHSPALPRRVEPHQPLRIAFGPTVEWYTADVVRTFCLGQPPAELVRLQDGFLEAQEAVIRLLRPGAAVPELMAAVRSVYERRSLMNAWRNNIGHGLGITIHEPPRVGGASNEVLAAGMVIAVEPVLAVPELGGYSHCDVFLITASGSELLTPGLHGMVQV
jgi:Xaa-Pro aminopeptidase